MQILSSANRRRVRNFEFLLRQAAKPSGELFSASPAILNYSVVNYNKQGKHRRLWRLAVATQPSIADYYTSSAPCPEGTRIFQKPIASSEGAQLWDRHPLTLSWFRKAGPTIVLNIIQDVSVPLRGTIFRWRCRTYPQLRCFAACSGFHDIGPAPRNQHLKLNLLVVRGCVATARRHSLLGLSRQAHL